MTDSTTTKSEDNPLLAALLGIFFICTVLHLPFRFFLNPYWMNKQARIKMQNPDNLTTSCVSFVRYTRVGSRTAHPTTEYSVDGIVFNTFSMRVLDNSPAKKNIRQFYDDADKYQHSKCYKVSYLYLDYIIEEKMYIYEYFGAE